TQIRAAGACSVVVLPLHVNDLVKLPVPTVVWPVARNGQGTRWNKRGGNLVSFLLQPRRTSMKLKLLIAAAGLAAFVTPSLAAEVYISWVREPPITHEQKPRPR